MQGGSGMEGLLASVRDILWAPITQAAFRWGWKGLCLDLPLDLCLDFERFGPMFGLMFGFMFGLMLGLG